VWLPPGYNDSASGNTLYPTLYLNDGQSLFDASTSLFGDKEWRVDEVADSLIRLGEIPPIVIIGIDNAGRRGRAKEYLPYPDEYLDPPEPNPLGSRYPEFLRRDVIPFIEDHYRVSKSRSDRYLGGSSYGALISQFVAVDSPDLFSGLLLESPSFYVENNRILELTKKSEPTSLRVYLGVGTNELALDGCPDHPGNQEAVDGVQQMARILRAKGLENGTSIFVNIEKCAQHRESAWARRLPKALQFLFGQEARSITMQCC
jgi:predicted alpha/beta superfamily hydrolase